MNVERRSTMAPAKTGPLRGLARPAVVTLTIATCTLASKLAGFGRELIMARYFGVTADVDALLVAITPYWVFILVVGEALRFQFIPKLTAEETRYGLAAFWRASAVLVRRTAVIGIVLSTTLALSARWWVPAIAPGASKATLELAIRLAWLLSPIVAASLVGNVLVAVLNARGRLLRSAIADLAYNAFGVPFVLLFAGTLGIRAAAWGWTGGYVLYCLVLLGAFAGRRLPWRGSRPGAALGLLDAAPLMFIAAATPITMAVDRLVASRLPTGSIAALNYAFKLFFFPVGILVGALGAVSYPRLARSFASQRQVEAGNAVAADLTIYLVLATPLSAFFAVASLEIVELFFRRGVFDSAAARLTADCLRAYSFGILPYGAGVLLMRANLAANARRGPVVATSVALATNVLLDVVLSGTLAAPGVALAFGCAGLVSAVLYGAQLLRRARGAIPDVSVMLAVLGCTVAGIAALRIVPSGGGSPLAWLLARGGLFAVVVAGGYAATGVWSRTRATLLRSAEATS